MDKLLIDLLNEYTDSKDFTFVEHNEKFSWFDILMDWKTEFLWDELIFSLKFWFINWLFETDHIDIDKCNEDEDFHTLSREYEIDDAVIMTLAIRYSAYNLLLERIK